MTHLEKFLAKLAPKEQAVIFAIIERILAFDFNGLDIKKLKGYADTYRVRKGDIRIIFLIDAHKVTLVGIGRRNDNTY